mmetsp:Transcript_20521/g.52045  ORF Transcript_20521/g.52045 Transcript_20521/m.52045 type:complete len:99 (+) Transcript_20521:2635-2931(+)
MHAAAAPKCAAAAVRSKPHASPDRTVHQLKCQHTIATGTSTNSKSPMLQENRQVTLSPCHHHTCHLPTRNSMKRPVNRQPSNVKKSEGLPAKNSEAPP